jgi:DNA-binding phage protein
MERDSPAEWLWQVRSIAEGAGADREALLEAFRESGDPGLGLFAALGLG